MEKKKSKKNYLKQLKLHEAQWKVHESDARFKVLVAGRRTGKSRLMLTEVISKCINFNQDFDLASPPIVLLGMPSLKQARGVHWQSILNILTDHPLVKKIYRSDFRIQFKGLRPDLLLRGCNDGNGDSLRGLKIYFAGLDEFQDIKPQVWEEVVYPALSDTPNSQALLIGTPKMSNIYFKSLFDLAPERPDWDSFHFTTYDNKYFPRERLEEAKQLLPPKIFEQEYMASWVSFGGQIFSELTSDHFISTSTLPLPFDVTYCGIDWGDINPATVILGKKGSTYFLVDHWLNPHPNNAVSLETHLKHTLEMCMKWNVERAFADPSSPTKIMNFRQGGVPKLITGLNAIDTGNSIINSLLYQNRLYITDKNKTMYEQMIGYHREERDGIINEKVAQGQDDHLCFVAETQVATPLGWINIEYLKVGDYVLTPEGERKITFTADRIDKVIPVFAEFNNELDLDNPLYCTPDHPFFDINSNQIKAKDLNFNPIRACYLNDDQFEKDHIFFKLFMYNLKHTERVYNIEVEEVHQYYVRVGQTNFGVLVSNCDAMRYVLATLEHKKIFKGLYLEDKTAPVIEFGQSDRLYK